MAYDVDLAVRTREKLGGRSGISEKQMFGGLSFLINGNLVCGVLGDELIVRVGPDRTDALLAEPGTRPFDFTGRPMRGWIVVGQEALQAEEDLLGWVERAFSFASTLPPKGS
jgi:TfoX/Sxy family transcriptional regulator of competence genes